MQPYGGSFCMEVVDIGREENPPTINLIFSETMPGSPNTFSNLLHPVAMAPIAWSAACMISVSIASPVVGIISLRSNVYSPGYHTLCKSACQLFIYACMHVFMHKTSLDCTTSDATGLYERHWSYPKGFCTSHCKQYAWSFIRLQLQCTLKYT